ncbi:MAG: hypothetical protein CR993_04505 [Rhodobacterales bacterium]|nr:MAG: hypothetical protein CR993_04505 [Rhodobacterales bacterium]
MKQAVLLLALVVSGLEMAFFAWGYGPVSVVIYGAIALMALMIAGTFLWLWFAQATPLALGMVYSWAGIGLVSGWWWVYNLMGQPLWAERHPGMFSVLALYVVGAVLHFAVIHRSFGYHGGSFVWPVGAALGLSVGVFLLV